MAGSPSLPVHKSENRDIDQMRAPRSMQGDMLSARGQRGSDRSKGAEGRGDSLNRLCLWDPWNECSKAVRCRRSGPSQATGEIPEKPMPDLDNDDKKGSLGRAGWIRTGNSGVSP